LSLNDRTSATVQRSGERFSLTKKEEQDYNKVEVFGERFEGVTN